MKFKDFVFRENNHFIAMQYYGLILNRTFLVIKTNELLIGIKVNGIVSIESGENGIVNEISKTIAVKGDLQNKYSYIKSKFINYIQDYELLDGSIFTQDKSNFIFSRNYIKNAYHDPRKKWGMGYYPHDGKVYIETVDGRKKEFIILGNQSGQKIVQLILAA